MSSCPLSLREQISDALAVLDKALSELHDAYQQPLSPLAPRPILLLTGFLASSTYLLEHARWSFDTQEPAREVDAEVFRRWVLEGGIIAAMEDVRRAGREVEVRAERNSQIVFGEPMKTKL